MTTCCLVFIQLSVIYKKLCMAALIQWHQNFLILLHGKVEFMSHPLESELCHWLTNRIWEKQNYSCFQGRPWEACSFNFLSLRIIALGTQLLRCEKAQTAPWRGPHEEKLTVSTYFPGMWVSPLGSESSSIRQSTPTDINWNRDKQAPLNLEQTVDSWTKQVIFTEAMKFWAGLLCSKS